MPPAFGSGIRVDLEALVVVGGDGLHTLNYGRRGSVKLAVLFALRAPDHTSAARAAPKAALGSRAQIHLTWPPRSVALEPLRGGIYCLDAFTVLFLPHPGEAVGAAWPRHAARRTPCAAGGAASTSARCKSPRPPASEKNEYI